MIRSRRSGSVIDSDQAGLLSLSWQKVRSDRLHHGLMPYINLQITKGATRAQKAKIVSEFTETLGRVLDKKPEHTHIVIEEIEDENWGFSGMLTDEYRKQR